MVNLSRPVGCTGRKDQKLLACALLNKSSKAHHGPKMNKEQEAPEKLEPTLRQRNIAMTAITIPMNELLICGGLVLFCFLLARFRLGISIAFAFTFYWGFVQHKELFFTNLETSTPYLVLYFGSGVILVAFALFSFVTGE
jgi:hypothetical protein